MWLRQGSTRARTLVDPCRHLGHHVFDIGDIELDAASDPGSAVADIVSVWIEPFRRGVLQINDVIERDVLEPPGMPGRQSVQEPPAVLIRNVTLAVVGPVDRSAVRHERVVSPSIMDRILDARF